MDRTQLDKIIEIVNGLVDGIGFECIEAEFNKKEQVLRLFVDWTTPAKDKPVNLDHCVQINKILDEDGALDRLISGPYTLEVSSPGVERPLRMEKHFRSHIGETIQIRLREKVEGLRLVTGTLLSVSAEQAGQITLETEAGLVSLPLASMHKANVVFDWAAH